MSNPVFNRSGRLVRRGVALGLALLLFGATAAMAADESVKPGEVHCVAQVVDVSEKGELITEIECFGTFAEAIDVASDGELVLDSKTLASAALTDSALAGQLRSFTIGIHYDGYNGTGSSITVSGSSCTGGYWNTPTDMHTSTTTL